jgi:hypothetical protein
LPHVSSHKEGLDVDQAKISIQHGGTALTAEGSEAFVKGAMELWDKLIAVPVTPPLVVTSLAQPNATGPAAAETQADGFSQYGNVFDVADDKIKIIAHITGKSKAEQTRKVALLILFANYLKGAELVPSEMIRNACVDQGCYDSTNFAGYLKGLKSSVVMNTKSGGQYDIKLTAPGRKAARELADALQGSAE